MAETIRNRRTIMWNGKRKALTFSYDDGTTQDIRLAEIFRRYGCKATFNLNSGLLGQPGELMRDGVRVGHNKVSADRVRQIYNGFEIASHTLTHPNLTQLSEEQIVCEVEEDRNHLSELVGYEVVGMAYPCGGVNQDERVAEIIKRRTGIRYARTTMSTYRFDPQDDLMRFCPTVHHHADWEAMFRLGEQFLALSPQTPSVFYIWGHSFEFDLRPSWNEFEDFCRMMAGREDIFYGTNSEVLLP